jgi:hypothetical protein
MICAADRAESAPGVPAEEADVSGPAVDDDGDGCCALATFDARTSNSPVSKKVGKRYFCPVIAVSPS